MTERKAAGNRPLAFVAAGHRVERLSLGDAPVLQHLLQRCGDYYELVEGRPAGARAALEELTDGPPERVPHDLICFGIRAVDTDALVGTIGTLRNHRRANQWYLGLMLLAPDVRGQGLGASSYRAFERWIVDQGGDSILLAVVEANIRAARFWQSQGFGWPRCYPERKIGLRTHILIEYEKNLRPAR